MCCESSWSKPCKAQCRSLALRAAPALLPAGAAEQSWAGAPAAGGVSGLGSLLCDQSCSVLSCFEIAALAVPRYMFQQKVQNLFGVWFCLFFPLAGGLVGCPFNSVVSPPDVNSALVSGGSGGTEGPLSLQGTAAAPVCGWACLCFTGTSSCNYRGKSGINTFVVWNVVPWNTLHPFEKLTNIFSLSSV